MLGRRKKDSYSFLVVGLLAGEEVIFQVAKVLRPQLEDVLASHSG